MITATNGKQSVIDTQMPESKVMNTVDYESFQCLKINRNINRRHMISLAEAIRISDLLNLNPIAVNREKFIIEGQHRWAAAQYLKDVYEEEHPLYYFIVDLPEKKITGTMLADIQLNHRNWALEDYLDLYCVEALPEYLRLRDFYKENNPKDQPEFINLKRCISLTYEGKSAETHTRGEHVFKRGEYQLNDLAFASFVVALLRLYSETAQVGALARRRNFQTAIIWTIQNDLMSLEDHKDDIRRMRSNSITYHHRGNAIQDYVRAIEDYHNYGRSGSNRLDLVRKWTRGVS